MRRIQDEQSKDKSPDLPYGKRKEKSIYADMTKEEKREMMLKRLKDDEQRAKQMMQSMKKGDGKKKVFMTKKEHFDLTTEDKTGMRKKEAGRDLITMKKQYDFSSGYAITLCKIPDKEAYYLGQSTGRILLFTHKKDQIVTVVNSESPTLDILALSKDRFVAADDFGRVKLYDQFKLVKVLQDRCFLVGGTYSYSKILVGNENYFFYINEAADKVVKVNLTDISVSYIDLKRPKLFQLALQDDTIFAISEEGFLIKATIMDLNKMNVDELEAYPDGAEIEEVQIEQLTNEQMGLEFKSHANDMLESSYMLDTEKVDLETSGGEDFLEEASATMKKSQESYERMTRVFNQPVKVHFFRTIACSPDYITVSAHDGQGHNIIFLYSHKLELKAFKYLRLDDQDYGFNLTKYIHKMQIEKRKEGSYLFAVTHKKGYRIYVYKIDNFEIKSYRRFKNIHSNMITDLRLDNEVLATTGRDRCFNFYHLDFKIDGVPPSK